MKIEINGNRITNGFLVHRKVGVSLFVNTTDRNVELEYTSTSKDDIEFGFSCNNEEESSTIKFTFETLEEIEQFKDCMKYTSICKEQFEFFFIKWEDLLAPDDNP